MRTVSEICNTTIPREFREQLLIPILFVSVYQDLLTLAVTSNVTKWNITWENCATQSLDDFLVAELKFNILQIALSEVRKLCDFNPTN